MRCNTHVVNEMSIIWQNLKGVGSERKQHALVLNVRLLNIYKRTIF